MGNQSCEVTVLVGEQWEVMRCTAGMRCQVQEAAGAVSVLQAPLPQQSLGSGASLAPAALPSCRGGRSEVAGTRCAHDSDACRLSGCFPGGGFSERGIHLLAGDQSRAGPLARASPVRQLPGWVASGNSGCFYRKVFVQHFPQPCLGKQAPRAADESVDSCRCRKTAYSLCCL